MTKTFGVKKFYMINSICLIILSPILLVAGILGLIFSPVLKIGFALFGLLGVFTYFMGKTVASNQIIINDDFVFIKQGLGLKTTECKFDYNEIISVKGNKAGGVIFDTKTGTVTVTYIDNAEECAKLINSKLK